MSRPDKYNPYVSQQPVDTNVNSRASKRRRWKDSWQLFLAQEGKMNYIRQGRRAAWNAIWCNFRDGGSLKSVNDSDTEAVNTEVVNETVSELG